MSDVDVFPQIVSLPDGSVYDQARLIVSDGTVCVFQTGPDRTPLLMASARLTGPPATGRKIGQVHTENGIWTTRQGAGCGCRSPLRRVPRDVLLKLAETEVGM